MAGSFKKFILNHFFKDEDLYRNGWVFLADGWVLKQPIEREVNKRVAEIILKMDPFEPLLKHYHGIFREEFEKVEENLDERSRFSMAMWAWGQKKDPHFKRMVDWVMDNAGNETLKRAPISYERTQYGRAQIANMILFKREIGRLASIYEEFLGKNKGEDVDLGVSVE